MSVQPGKQDRWAHHILFQAGILVNQSQSEVLGPIPVHELGGRRRGVEGTLHALVV